MAGVIGIGGIFLKFKDPEMMKEWYKNVLHLKTNDYGVLFEFNGNTSNSKGYLQLGTFASDSDYFGKPEQQSMINFRIDDLIAFQTELIQKKVSILDSIEEFSYGKFLHIEDPEGNKIELWEPVDTEFEASTDPKVSMK